MLISVVMSSVFALGVAEYALDKYSDHLRSKESMTPGLIQYNSQRGWALTPNWQGVHQHQDYKVSYTINHRGFRGEFEGLPRDAGQRVAIVGDSFTFGFGVEDFETFSGQLERKANGTLQVLNFGVPGTSTDQQLLLIQDQVLGYKPNVIILVAYLANDLIDNQLGFPLQTENAKPFFTLVDDRLVLENVPVPRQRKPPVLANHTLSSVILGGLKAETGWLGQYLARSHVASLLGWRESIPPETLQQQFETKLAGPLKLFNALVLRLQDALRETNTRFILALLPGQSYLKTPDSISGQYQEYLRSKIKTGLAETGISVVDIGAQLAKDKPSEALYFPNDGHLNTAGHLQVAKILADAL